MTVDDHPHPNPPPSRGREQSARPSFARGPLAHVHTFDALQFRDFRLLWLGQATTGLAQWMDQVTRGWLMYELTDSPLQLGAVGAIRAVPLIFFSVLAGVVADRYGRKAQLVISQVTNSALNFALGFLVLTGQVQP